jgi:DNA-binding transcriptional regulator YbjK
METFGRCIFVIFLVPSLALGQTFNTSSSTLPSGASFADHVMHQPRENMVSTNPVEKILNNINPADQAGCMAAETVHQSFMYKGSRRNNVRSVSRMPEGYFNGMILSFAQNQCQLLKQPAFAGNSYEGRLSQPSDASSQKSDTLGHYIKRSDGSWLRSVDPLVANYALMFPLGMLESSGKFRDGIDRLTSSSKPGEEVEAGLFQVSMNSTNLGSPRLRSLYAGLMQKYQNGNDQRSCMADVFSMGLPKNPPTQNFGNPEHVAFQDAMKKCPALAVDYMALLLRTNHRHNGPLNRYEAKPRQACVNALNAVKEVLSSGSANCESLNTASVSSFASVPGYDSRIAAVNDRIGKIKVEHRADYDVATGRQTFRSNYSDAQSGTSANATSYADNIDTQSAYQEFQRDVSRRSEISSEDIDLALKSNAARINEINQLLSTGNLSEEEKAKAMTELYELSADSEKLQDLKTQKEQDEESGVVDEVKLEEAERRLFEAQKDEFSMVGIGQATLDATIDTPEVAKEKAEIERLNKIKELRKKINALKIKIEQEKTLNPSLVNKSTPDELELLKLQDELAQLQASSS